MSFETFQGRMNATAAMLGGDRLAIAAAVGGDR